MISFNTKIYDPKVKIKQELIWLVVYVPNNKPQANLNCSFSFIVFHFNCDVRCFLFYKN